MSCCATFLPPYLATYGRAAEQLDHQNVDACRSAGPCFSPPSYRSKIGPLSDVLPAHKCSSIPAQGVSRRCSACDEKSRSLEKRVLGKYALRNPFPPLSTRLIA